MLKVNFSKYLAQKNYQDRVTTEQIAIRKLNLLSPWRAILNMQVNKWIISRITDEFTTHACTIANYHNIKHIVRVIVMQTRKDLNLGQKYSIRVRRS